MKNFWRDTSMSDSLSLSSKSKSELYLFTAITYQFYGRSKSEWFHGLQKSWKARKIFLSLGL